MGSSAIGSGALESRTRFAGSVHSSTLVLSRRDPALVVGRRAQSDCTSGVGALGGLREMSGNVLCGRGFYYYSNLVI